MTTLTITNATYARLRAVAAARRLSVEAYLDQVVAGVPLPAAPDAAAQLAAIEAFTAWMTAWTAEHLPPGHVVDDSRDAIYEGRGG